MSTAQSGSAMSPFHRFPVIIGNIRIPLFFKFSQNPNKLEFKMEKEFNQTKTIGGYVFEHWGKKPTKMSGSIRIKKDSSLANLIGLNTKLTNFGIDDAVYSPELQTLQTLFNVDQRKIKPSAFLDTISQYVGGAVTTILAGKAVSSNPVSAVMTVKSGIDKAFRGKNSKFREPEQASIDGYLSTITDTIILYKGVLYSGFFTSLSYVEDGEKPFYNEVKFEFLVTNTTDDWLATSLTQTTFGRTLSTLFGATTSITTVGSLISDLFTDSGSDTNGHV